MKKKSKNEAGEAQNGTPATHRGRILARALAEDLQLVRGEEDQPPMMLDATRTDPPPGYDVTFRGSDGSENLF